ncbi:MAG TPA: enoyl-CoA hydratase/isomerase family protein [Actinophytocola sp.]|uniref:enoyl-CoA hydratase/isomerase family protein n=1 Tax=Actinophytocola sp. TaxID=1872138 RepID=UPI002DDCE401|nr:enoyl-CoA hydratase/isomerase family protein [Actinophytocola sp.]HEV2778467.1 enoyl-CoA hydratase/isomerase family protein [Actinophytocola sp.]
MIEVTDHAGIAVLRLNRGPVNVLDLELLGALPDTLAGVAGAAAVVLTGAGRCFSAGVDLKRIVEGGPAYVAEFLPALSTAALALFDHPRPVVAAVNGHALAGGCVLAAACDVRLMSAGTIGLTELAAGVPFPAVPMEIMRHAVGAAASELVLTARVMDPAAARGLGLIHDVVEPDDLLSAALLRAERLATTPAAVYALSKEQLHRPTRDRIDATRPLDDPRVLELWSSPATHQTLREFLAALANR